MCGTKINIEDKMTLYEYFLYKLILANIVTYTLVYAVYHRIFAMYDFRKNKNKKQQFAKLEKFSF